MHPNKIIIITGQTATGKTTYARTLASRINGELINSDARQIYQGLDIVTGKDKNTGTFHLVEKKGDFHIGFYKTIKTWLYDIISPDILFSPYHFAQLSSIVLKHIQNRGKIPIFVGGTYLYIHYLFFQKEIIDIPPNEHLRESLSDASVEELQKILQSYNHDLFNELNESDTHNPQRLLRKIEIAHHIKKHGRDIKQTFSLIDTKKFDIEIHGLRFVDRDILRKAIHNRVRKRLQEGAIEETKKILQKKYTQSSPGLQAIGYRQIIDYLNEKITYQELIDTWITKEVQYAKRQETFMKKNTSIIWHEIT